MDRFTTLAVVAVCLLAATALAADFTWDGGAYISGNEATRNWDLAANWNPDGVPAAGQTALVNISNRYAIANADLAGSPAVEVAAGALVIHPNNAALSMPITLNGGTWHTSPWGTANQYDGAWSTNRNLNGTITVAAPSFFKGIRGTRLTVNGPLQGSALLTFKSDDSYQGDGPDFTLAHANNPFAGGILIEAGLNPIVWAGASQALGTGDITVRTTGVVGFTINQNYAGAARTPVIFLEGGQVRFNDYLANAAVPMNIVVQVQGGTIFGSNWANNCTISGTVTLNGSVFMNGSRCSSANNFTVTGRITGPGGITVNTTDVYSGQRGAVALANATNDYQGGTTLQSGFLRLTAEGALGSGPLTLYTPDSLTRVYLDKAANASWSLGNDLAGTGTVQVETGSGYTLAAAGTIRPGVAAGAVGTLTIQGHLGFAGGSRLRVDLNATDPLNPVADAVAVTGNVSNLASAALEVAFSGDSNVIAGREFTILTCANDLTGQNFGSVVVPTGWDKVVVCGNGSVKVVLFPEGATQPVLQVLPSSLVYDLKSFEPAPAAQAVQVKNLGAGTLAWSADVRSPSPAWISLADTTGGDNDSFQVSVNQAGLEAGTYTAYVDVSDPAAINSPAALIVTMKVTVQDSDVAKANRYDDAWQTGPDGWVIAMRQIKRTWSGKNDGFVTLLGDSITYANPFGQWARYGSGKTAADTAICTWMHAGVSGTGSNNSNNGWWLAAYDVPGRGGSYTAKSGIRADQFLAGNYSLPSLDQMFTAGFTNPDGKQYRDAMIAVILLGTNDCGGRSAAAVAADLGTMCDKLFAAKVIPVLTTIPPKSGQVAQAQAINDAIRALAQTKKVPLIDYYAEIMRRRPGDTWFNTLISSDGVHPTASGGAYNSQSSPYASNGEALSNVGYLLRCWLTVQKIQEVKTRVLDAPAGDADGDNDVDVFDVIDAVVAFGTCAGDALFNAGADFDGNGCVEFLDVMQTINNFGTGC